ncbi:MAG: PspC domain-containing protein [Bacteroidales bacterium]
MKKTATVSLGGMIFCFEEDAYLTLDAYLKRLEYNFRSEPDTQEIMKDIEVRMAEHFREKAPTQDVVITLSEVNRVIEIMGDPTDIGAESKGFQSAESGQHRKAKRLYRDPDNRVIAGISSGLGFYWNIDPVIIRVLFVILAIWGGGGVFVYIILWIVIPEATTIAEKLEMTGEPVTAENIGKSFKGSNEQKNQ